MEQQLPTYVGPLEPWEFTVGAQVQAQYLEALEDYHLRYLLGHEGIPPVIHPGILLSHSNATRSPSFTGPNTRWIHLREQTHFIAFPRLGDTLIVRWRIEEHEPWLGRVLTRVSSTVTRCDGQVILERIMWGFRSSTQRPIPPMAGRAQGGEAAESGHPGAAPTGPGRSSAPIDLDPSDWEIPGKTKQLTTERIRLFSGRAAQNLHTDVQIAHEAGLPAPVASAAQGMGFLCEFMIDNLGVQWLSGGSWVLTFRKPVFPGDRVHALGRLRHVEPTQEGAQCTIDLQLVNQRGITVTQGTATCQTELP